MKDLKYLFPLFIVVTMSLIAASCSDDKDDEPTEKVTITNNCTYSLPDFVVIFSNDSHETFTREEKGTFRPKDVITVNIPSGATIYYMGMHGEVWSPDYATSVRSIVLTDNIVSNWSIIKE